MTTNTHCGFIAILGRPNVGKSTLMNHLLGQKISITSRRPQTTRERIVGVKTDGNHQMIFLDTPGVYASNQSEMDRCLQKTAVKTIGMVDLIVFVVEANQWKPADQWILDHIKKSGFPVLLVINKIDKMDNREELLPFMEAMQGRLEAVDMIPVSALKSLQLDALQASLKSRLPEHPFCFPEDQITDRSDVFVMTETIREKVFRILGQELPYSTAVSIDKVEMVKKRRDIYATIWVEKDSQKAIVIGKKGDKIKNIGTQARADLETYFDGHVNLQLWVKVRRGWTKDPASLKEFGVSGDDD